MASVKPPRPTSRKAQRPQRKQGIHPFQHARTVAGRHGHGIYPSAERFIKNEVQRAIKIGTIDPEQAPLGTYALVAAAIEAARLRGGARTVKVTDVRTGWQRYMSLGPPNHPIHRCLKRSVVNRAEDLESQSDILADLLDKAK